MQLGDVPNSHGNRNLETSGGGIGTEVDRLGGKFSPTKTSNKPPLPLFRRNSFSRNLVQKNRNWADWFKSARPERNDDSCVVQLRRSTLPLDWSEPLGCAGLPSPFFANAPDDRIDHVYWHRSSVWLPHRGGRRAPRPQPRSAAHR